jgi:hypothetical protein
MASARRTFRATACCALQSSSAREQLLVTVFFPVWRGTVLAGKNIITTPFYDPGKSQSIPKLPTHIIFQRLKMRRFRGHF